MDQQLGKLTELITYYRVSDKKQGDGEHSGTGHGIDAQKRDVEFLRQRLGGVVIESYTEVESGGKDDRPMLAEAIAKWGLDYVVLTSVDRDGKRLHAF